jgi:hypothetical protein
VLLDAAVDLGWILVVKKNLMDVEMPGTDVMIY